MKSGTQFRDNGDEATDYYQTLNIPRDADANTIKKSYRQLAIQWHPDKNQVNREEATERFKLIGEAYKVLSDTEARRNYDMTFQHRTIPRRGRNDFTEFHSHFGFGDAEELFATVFGDMGMKFAGRSGGLSLHRRPQGRNSRGSMFDDFFSGFGFNGPMGADFFGPMAGSFDGISTRGASFAQSTSTTTHIVNGRRITRTVTERSNPDGTTECRVATEETDPTGRVIHRELPPEHARPRRILQHPTHGMPFRSHRWK